MNYRIKKIEINSFVIDMSSYKENMSVFSNKGFEIACDDSAHIVKIKTSFSLYCENDDNNFLSIEQAMYYGIHSKLCTGMASPVRCGKIENAPVEI